MVKIKQCNYIKSDGNIDIQDWLNNIASKRLPGSIKLITQACQLSQLVDNNELILNSNKTCLHLGLEIAEILFDLHADQYVICAAILFCHVQYGDLTIDVIEDEIGPSVARLLVGAERMDLTRILFDQAQLGLAIQQRNQIDNIRKMMLAMVEDVRVVMIKLAEKTAIIRAASVMPEPMKRTIAMEIFHIYAPLANRLGIGQLKWELEDLCFRYLHADTYKTLAKKLAEKRLEREAFIKRVESLLSVGLIKLGIKTFKITGRAKHIFSIYRKMSRKNVDYEQIYDVSAVRILVDSVEDCYAALSCVHELWPPIPEEFDDYIAHPKPNGYRSLHTAVVGPENRNLEVQIRTFAIHQESELGVAAHWKYKEGHTQQSDYEKKIAWLRNVLEWQQDLVAPESKGCGTQMQQIFGDRVYVFTPAGEIVDLPKGATPLDFAYHIHTQIGHRCKGAKINEHIVPLTYQLSTGDRVTILTRKIPKPSRDWLIPQTGYVTTSRARAKIHQYFRKLDYEQYIQQGYKDLEIEIKRLGHGISFNQINFANIAAKLHYRSTSDLFAAIGTGDLKLGQACNTIKELLAIQNVKPEPNISSKMIHSTNKLGQQAIEIEGVDNLLTVFAGCCKPIPGDVIVGFITRGRGVSIHRKDCNNIIKSKYPERLINVNWATEAKHETLDYPVDLHIIANDRQDLVRDVLSMLAAEKIPLMSLRTRTKTKDNQVHLEIQIKSENIDKLECLIKTLKKSADIQRVTRHHL